MAITSLIVRLLGGVLNVPRARSHPNSFRKILRVFACSTPAFPGFRRMAHSTMPSDHFGVRKTLHLGSMEKIMKRTFALIWLAACSACPATVAAAAPAGSVMLAPGVYTTADISRRCQTYTGARVRDTMQDTSRRAVFLACVQRLSRNENAGAPSVSAVEPPLIEAPVSLPTSGYGPFGLGCSTDEGYGRRGSCDNI